MKRPPFEHPVHALDDAANVESASVGHMTSAATAAAPFPQPGVAATVRVAPLTAIQGAHPSLFGAGVSKSSSAWASGTIGAILVESGRLNAADAERIAVHQREAGLPFGEAGRALGVIGIEDVRFALARQFSLPSLAEGDPALDPEVLAAFHPSDPRVEQIRQLRAQIMLQWVEPVDHGRALAIVSAEPGAGRSYVAANLAAVFAQLGQKTLLIDADLPRPRQDTLFRVGGRLGLASMLAGRGGPEVIQSIDALPGLSVLPAGMPTPNPHDLLARPVFRQMLARCVRDYDVVIVDTPPWSAGSGTRMIAAATKAALLLVRAGRSDAYAARAMRGQLADAGVKVLGVAFNAP